jgi:hypothetical protein
VKEQTFDMEGGRIMIKKRMLLLLLLVLITACSSNGDIGGSEGAKTDNGGCPYNGAVVEVNYSTKIPFEKIEKIWSDNGWQTANPEADGHTIVGVISGSFEGEQWVIASVYQTEESTLVSIWVNEDADESMHDKQISKASLLLSQMEAVLDKDYPTKGERTSGPRSGCIQD